MNQSIFVTKIPAWSLDNAKIGETSKGTPRLRVKVPVENRVNRNGTWENETTWIPLVLYGERGVKFLEIVKGGSVISFVTKYRSYKYEEKYYHEFTVDQWNIESWGDGGTASGDEAVEEVSETDAPF